MSDGPVDAIVVGGGFIGLATALHLRRRGASVRVMERARVGDGASSRSSGWLSAQLRTPNALLAIVVDSLVRYADLIASLDDDCGYAVCGSIVVADTHEELAKRRVLDAEQRGVRAYSGATFLTAEEARGIAPGIMSTAVGASYAAADAQVDPERLVRALSRAATREGASIHEGAEVTQVRHSGGAWTVTTPSGEHRGRALVNAAGAWSPAIAALVDEPLPVRPIAGQMLVSRPYAPLAGPCVVYQPDARFAGRSACGIRQDGDGRLWMGTTYRADTFDTSITAEDTATILSGACTLFPELRDVVIERAFAGVRPVPADLVPVYGRSAKAPDLYVGVPVAGLAETAAAGVALADLIALGATDVPVEGLGPDRFGDRI